MVDVCNRGRKAGVAPSHSGESERKKSAVFNLGTTSTAPPPAGPPGARGPSSPLLPQDMSPWGWDKALTNSALNSRVSLARVVSGASPSLAPAATKHSLNDYEPIDCGCSSSSH